MNRRLRITTAKSGLRISYSSPLLGDSCREAVAVILEFAEMTHEPLDLSCLAHDEINTNYLVAPVIFRLARTQKQWRQGQVSLKVAKRLDLEGPVAELAVHLAWAIDALDEVFRYNPQGHSFRHELRRLRHSVNERHITELAAVGVTFALVSVMLPEDRITRVAQIGERGDYYLNGRMDEMIEVSGVKEGGIDQRFEAKREQILKNRRLTRAFVSVIGFDPLIARFERVI